jgi:hypothetical protein
MYELYARRAAHYGEGAGSLRPSKGVATNRLKHVFGSRCTQHWVAAWALSAFLGRRTSLFGTAGSWQPRLRLRRFMHVGAPSAPPATNR